MPTFSGRRCWRIRTRRLDGRPQSIMLFSNIRENGKLIGSLADGEMFFHSDLCYIEHPVIGTMLYSVEVLPRSAATRSLPDQYAAYEALPAATKAKI